MKVCYFVNDFANGGVEAVVYNYLSHMDLSNYEIHIISYNMNDQKCYEKFKQLGVDIFLAPPRRGYFFRGCFKIYRQLRKWKIDIVHTHVNDFNCVPVALAFLAGIKVRISHSHSVNNQFKSVIAKALDVIKCIGGLIFATDYWACGEMAAERLFGKKVVATGRVHYMYNAVDCSLYYYNQSLREQVRKELGIDNKLCIGHIARFSKEKNNAFVVEMFDNIYQKDNNAVLLLIGDGKDRKLIENTVIEKGLSHNVLMLGSRNDAYRFYHAMDIFVLPSLYEGVPVTAIEAQLSGVLSIVSDRISEEIIQTDMVKMLPIDNPNVWAEYIYKAINEEKTIERKKHYIAKYDINIQAVELDKNYHDLYRRSQRNN